MTIYSQHANRGKIQVLATYEGSAGIMSSTVTSLADPNLAEPLVDALNRISTLTAVAISVRDTRGGSFDHYPTTHLAALTDRSARSGLRDGTHSLWYEYVCVLLHQALTDLDRAMAAVPEPVRTAINAELETEERELRDAYAEYSEGVAVPESANRRYWDSDSPFVAATAETRALSPYLRERLDHLEKGITVEQRKKAVADLRRLVDAYAQCPEPYTVLELDHFAIFAEPFDSDGYYLTVDAPSPDGDGADSWRVVVGLWEPDDPDDEEYSSATGKTILSCACDEPPSATEISTLLKLIKPQGKLAEWAKVPTGTALSGTAFTVTERDNA